MSVFKKLPFCPSVNTYTSQRYFLKSDFLQYLFINFCVVLLSMPQGILRSVSSTEMGLEIFRPKERSYLLFRELNFSDLKSPSALKKKVIIEKPGLRYNKHIFSSVRRRTLSAPQLWGPFIRHLPKRQILDFTSALLSVDCLTQK